MAAKISRLAELHEALAEMFLEDIRICREEGIPMAAADKGVMVTFLKNNNITADADDETMSSLKDEFKNELAERRQARAAAITEAAGEDDKFAGIM
jgi:hypothetical protein